jgi:hypothetical protein
MVTVNLPHPSCQNSVMGGGLRPPQRGQMVKRELEGLARALGERKECGGEKWVTVVTGTFYIQVHPNAAVLLVVSVQTIIGDDAATLFWTDQWLEGKSLGDLAPNLVAVVPKRVAKSRTIQ